MSVVKVFAASSVHVRSVQVAVVPALQIPFNPIYDVQGVDVDPVYEEH